MKVTVAIDSFKGSLDTFEAASAVEAGIRRVFPGAEVFKSPVADGGEGTAEAIVYASGGKFREMTVRDPLHRPIRAKYGITGGGALAVIEMARAAGITLLSESEKNPYLTSTFGVGEMILDAIDSGCRKFIIGIGGSATNDGGIGMLGALGVKFLNAEGKEIPLCAGGLEELAAIDVSGMRKELSECSFSVACDVTNPLCGEFGCSAVYGPQKGADEKAVRDMDAWLARYAELTRTVIPSADATLPGSGAAGGIGFALVSYLGAKSRPGIELVTEAVGLEELIKDSDVVITGEGRLDAQSVMGKAPMGVARLAKKYGKPVIAFCGAIASGAGICHEFGIDALFPIVRSPISLSEAMEKETAKMNLEACVEEVFRALRLKI